MHSIDQEDKRQKIKIFYYQTLPNHVLFLIFGGLSPPNFSRRGGSSPGVNPLATGQRVNKSSINWLCKVPKCSGSVTISKIEEKIERFIDHDFEIVHEKFDKMNQIQSKFKVSC